MHKRPGLVLIAGGADRVSGEPFRLSPSQRDELARIAPELVGVADRIERVIGRFIDRGQPKTRDGFSELLRETETAYAQIANLAELLLTWLEWVRKAGPKLGQLEMLAPRLAKLQGEGEAMPAIAAAIREVGTLANAAGEVHLEALTYRTAQPGQPPKYDSLIDGLEGAVCDACRPPWDDISDEPPPLSDCDEEEGEEWEKDWKPWAAPSGRFCRLVGLALDAAGEPEHSNLAQTVRRALEGSAAAFAAQAASEETRRKKFDETFKWWLADRAKQERWQAHLEQNCTPETCPFCSG